MTTLALTRTHGHALRDVHVWAGAASGVIASLVMGMAVMGATWAQGDGLFFVPEKIATLVLSDASAATALGITAGLGIHMVLGAVFGVFFAVSYTRLTSNYLVSTAVALGVLFGLGLWIANFLIIGPAVGAQLTASVGPELAIPTHIIFGFALGIYARLVKNSEG